MNACQVAGVDGASSDAMTARAWESTTLTAGVTSSGRMEPNFGRPEKSSRGFSWGIEYSRANVQDWRAAAMFPLSVDRPDRGLDGILQQHRDGHRSHPAWHGGQPSGPAEQSLEIDISTKPACVRTRW